MQRAETLLEIIHGRGKRGLPLERLYRHLFNPELYLRAYGKIYRNDGSMTPGVNAETVDGMSLKKIQVIIDGPRSDVSTSTRKDHRESVARWVCPRGRTSCCRK
jgi:hypothetical protein